MHYYVLVLSVLLLRPCQDHAFSVVPLLVLGQSLFWCSPFVHLFFSLALILMMTSWLTLTYSYTNTLNV